MLIGLCMASFVFLPIVRATTGFSELVYIVPIVILTVLGTLRNLNAVSFTRATLAHIILGMTFCSWMLLSSMWTLSTGQVIMDSILIVYFLLILILSASLHTIRVARWVLFWIIVSAIITSAGVLAGYYLTGNLKGYNTPVHEFYLVASSIIGAGCVGLATHLLFTYRPRGVLFVPLLLLFSGLALSLGRMALIATIALTLVFGLYASKPRSLWKYSRARIRLSIIQGGATALLIGGVLWGAMQVDRTASRISRLLGGVDRELSVGGRGQLWSSAWDAIGHAPLLGHGLGSSGVLASGREGYYPHNLFLQIWVDGGLVGVLLMGLLLAYPLTLLIRSKLRSDPHLLPLVAIYLFFILTYQTSSSVYTARPLVLLGVLITGWLSTLKGVRRNFNG